MKFNLKFAFKSALVGAVLAATPLTEALPGISTAAFAQNICADGTPFKSKRKSQTMSPRVYRKYEKILELNDLASESAKQVDIIKTQIKEFETLIASKDMKKEGAKVEVQALREQIALLKPQISPLEQSQTQSYNEIEELIKDVMSSRRTSDYENASMLQFYSQVHYSRGDTAKALAVLEEMLQYGSTLKELREHAVTYNVSQLNYAEGNYDKALDYVKKWFVLGDVVCHKVRMMQNVYIAQLYYQKEDFRNVLKYMNKAIDEANADPEQEPKENWYGIAATAHYRLDELKEYRDILEIMSIKYGKPEYYKRLASVHAELKDDKTAFALYEAMYEMGWMNDKESDLKLVAQIQFSQGSAIKAAWIMEEAMKEGRMEKSVANMRLLGQAYTSSSEYNKAVVPMAFVARETENAQAFSEVASLEYANNNMTNAVKMYSEAIRLFSKASKSKYATKIERSKIGKGAALLDLGRIMEACKIFKELSKSKNSTIRKQSKRFKSAVAADIARQDMFSGNDSKRSCK